MPLKKPFLFTRVGTPMLSMELKVTSLMVPLQVALIKSYFPSSWGPVVRPLTTALLPALYNVSCAKKNSQLTTSKGRF